MTIEAKVICDSIFADSKKRIISFETYDPRAILHEEFLTHRALSRNASSSRATPVSAMVEQVKTDPALPIRWGISGKGMQDHGEMTAEQAARVKTIFLGARDDMLRRVGQLMKLNPAPAKQIVNLLLRPWEHIRVVSTATEWTNFFALRMHKDAKPEFQELARKMWKAMRESTPRVLKHGEWHLPYIAQHELDALSVTREDKREEALGNMIKVSAARCARTSYLNHRGKVASFAEDIDLYDRLVGGDAMHASPLEHQCTPDTSRVVFDTAAKKVKRVWDNPTLHGNLVGWIQHRKTLPGENVTNYTPEGN